MSTDSHPRCPLCASVMKMVGGNMATARPWMKWKCPQCHHSGTLYGTLERINYPDGSVLDWWSPAPKPVLTVLTTRVPNGIFCRGICEDQDIFNNLLCEDEQVMIEYIGRQFSPAYRVVFNLPEDT